MSVDQIEEAVVAAPSVLSHAGLSQLLLSVSWASAASPSNRKRLGRTSSSQGINAIACGSHWLTQTPGLPETLARGHCSGPCGSAPERHPLGFSFTLKLESSGLHFQLHKTENDALVRPAPSPSVSVLSCISSGAVLSQGSFYLLTAHPQVPD